jgi:hypothetical protein
MESKIVFCLTGTSFSGRFFDCFLELVVYCVRQKIRFVFTRGESPVVYYARNMCLGGDVLRGENQKPFDGKIDYTHLMWIDNDIIFKPAQFQKLLDYDKNIISGIYLMSDQMHFATVKEWDEEKFKKQGCFDFLTHNDIKDKGLLDVAYTGMGFMLIKKGVFESLSYPWFRPLFYDFNGIKDFCSEDVSFCRLIKEKGYQIFVDPQLHVGHEKKIIL